MNWRTYSTTVNSLTSLVHMQHPLMLKIICYTYTIHVHYNLIVLFQHIQIKEFLIIKKPYVLNLGHNHHLLLNDIKELWT